MNEEFEGLNNESKLETFEEKEIVMENTLEEAPTMNVGVGIDPVTEPTKEVNETFDDIKPKKNNTGLFVGLGVVVLLLIAIGAGVFYYLNTFTAKAFLKKNAQVINTTIDKTFNNLLFNEVDFNEDDFIIDGNISFNTNKEELKDLNDITLKVKNELSIVNNLDQLTLDLKNGNKSVLTANVQLDKEVVYLKSKEIYEKSLKYTLFANVFDYLKDVKLEKISKDEIVKFLKDTVNEVEVIIEEEAKTTTTVKGLIVEYTYEIDDKVATSMNKKLYEYVKSSDFVKKHMPDQLEIKEEDFQVFGNAKLRAVVKVLGNSLEELEFIFDDNDIKAVKDGKDKYKVTTDESNSYVMVQINKDKVSMDMYEDGKKLSDYTFEFSNNVIEVTMKEDTMDMVLTVTKEKKKNTIVLTEKMDKLVVNEKAVITDEGDNKLKIDEVIEYVDNTDKYEVKYEGYVQYKKGLIDKMNFTDAVNVDELEFEELTKIMENATKIVEDNFKNIIDNFGFDSGDDFYEQDDDDFEYMPY